jgi:cell division transport system permease protein
VKLHQALLYFFREAWVSLARSWKVSLLAVVTIAVSLTIGGAFLLIGRNLSALVERWRDEARVVVYLRPDADAAARADLLAEIAAAPWVTAREERTAAEAAARFRQVFPGLADLLEGGRDEPLPPSIEIVVDPGVQGAAGSAFATWLAALRAHPAVELVDDDREWLRQLETLTVLVRGAGLTLGAILLAAAVFTIASVIRLTAYLYRDEIAVMRLVGATEFFIRGPFYTEGLIQGLVGGVLAVGGLYGAYAAAARRVSGTLVGAVLTPRFLEWQPLALLVLLGAAAGLAGAVVSLRREKLGSEE